MSYDIITVWAFGSHGGIAGLCSTESKAREAAKGLGWYGNNGTVIKRQAIKVFNDTTQSYEVYLLSTKQPTPADVDWK